MVVCVGQSCKCFYWPLWFEEEDWRPRISAVENCSKALSYLNVGPPRLCLALSFHHIARHQFRGVSPRVLALLPSGLYMSRLSFGLLWRCSIVSVLPE